MKVQNVISRTELMMVVGPEVEIEDAGDDFIQHGSAYNINREWSYLRQAAGGVRSYYNRAAVDQRVLELISTIKPTQKSVKVTDPELLDIIKVHNYGLSRLDKGRYGRRGDRLFIKSTPPKMSTHTKQDAKQYISLAIEMIASQWDIVDLTITGGFQNVHKKTFEFIRRSITRKEMLKWCEDNPERFSYNTTTIEQIKYFYNGRNC